MWEVFLSQYSVVGQRPGSLASHLSSRTRIPIQRPACQWWHSRCRANHSSFGSLLWQWRWRRGGGGGGGGGGGMARTARPIIVPFCETEVKLHAQSERDSGRRDRGRTRTRRTDGQTVALLGICTYFELPASLPRPRRACPNPLPFVLLPSPSFRPISDAANSLQARLPLH